MSTYIWQLPDWPLFTFDPESLIPSLTGVAYLQGKVEALSGQLGFVQSKELEARILSAEIHNSHIIEGELLEELQIYTSLCRRLQVPNASMKMSGAHVEGVVENLLDALGNAYSPLTEGRLLAWHTRLFPQGRSEPFTVQAGRYGTDSIEVASGSYKNQRVWFEAPPARSVPQGMRTYLAWINEPSSLPGIHALALYPSLALSRRNKSISTPRCSLLKNWTYDPITKICITYPFANIGTLR